MSSKLPPGKPVPPVYTATITTEWFRVLTWKERLAILFGCNVLVQIAIHCRHNPGQFQPIIKGIVSKEKTAKDHMRVLAEDSIEAKKPKYEITKANKAKP